MAINPDYANQKRICVAVTGANGFIGKPLVETLENIGVTVIATARIPQSSLQLNVDVCDKATWPNLFAKGKPSRLIHCAWGDLNNFESPIHYTKHFSNHLAFLLWCIESGIADITVAGTCFEYGCINGQLYEDMPAQPVAAYAIAKESLRRALEHYAKSKAFTLKWARIFFVSGDDEQEKGVFKYIKEAGEKGQQAIDLSWGEQLRDYISRKDAANFLAHFCLQDTVTGIVNCCSGEPHAMRRMIETYAEQWPLLKLHFGKLGYRDYEPMAFWGSITKMKKVLASGMDFLQKPNADEK